MTLRSRLTPADIVPHMERVLVQLTPEQLAVLREGGARDGRSIAALIREAVDLWITERGREPAIERALESVGRFRSGLGDLAENHDRYLDDGPP